MSKHMIAEHWLDDAGSTLFPACDLETHTRLFVGEPRKCCEIEGADWEDCLRQYHEHMGWEPYKPQGHSRGATQAVSSASHSTAQYLPDGIPTPYPVVSAEGLRTSTVSPHESAEPETERKSSTCPVP